MEERYPDPISLPMSEAQESLGQFLERQAKRQTAWRPLQRAPAHLAGQPLPPGHRAAAAVAQANQVGELRDTLDELQRAMNQLICIAMRQEALLAALTKEIAERLPKPAPAKPPLSMRAYRGMQCGFDDDR